VFAREALGLDPQSTEAAALEEEAMRRLDADTGAGVETEHPPLPRPTPVDQTMLAPARRTPVPAPSAAPRPVVAPTPKTTDRDLLAPLRTAGAAAVAAGRSAIARVNAVPAKQTQIAAGVVAVVVLAVAVWLFTPTTPPPADGTLVVDAVPWATIAAIEREDGSAVSLNGAESTPFSRALPPGTYRIRLAGPNREERVVTVTVGSGAVAAATIERFPAVTTDEYFERLLAAQPPGPAADEAAPDPAAAPNTEAPAADPQQAAVKPSGTNE
jgi:hypothetical protein